MTVRGNGGRAQAAGILLDTRTLPVWLVTIVKEPELTVDLDEHEK